MSDARMARPQAMKWLEFLAAEGKAAPAEVWHYVTDLEQRIDALEARNRKLEFKWESKEPGTQGAILNAFYALVETLPEYNPVMSEGHLNVLRKHLATLEAVREAAIDMRQYVSYRDIASRAGSARIAEEKLKAWDDALAAVGQGETKDVEDRNE